jgi:23S rRNA (cytidine1920-2'-O)/16S rRNA (cytidine1409-2'-O)-methyltransferase
MTRRSKTAPKTRLDALLVERGYAPTRNRAQRLIMAGLVRVDGQPVGKAGEPVPTDADVRVERDSNPFVSRGGLKLQAALDAFELDVAGRTALDVGASTGGFTDCLLQRGAARVYAVDVGYGQLDWSLRQDARVVTLERTNARHLTAEQVPEACHLAVFDVSFISLAKVVPAILPLLAEGADLLMLVKPQFEGEPHEIGKGGVIRDQARRLAIVQRAIARLEALGLNLQREMDSPIHGPKGNIEVLAWFRPGGRADDSSGSAPEESGS